jgi:DNA-binding NtrC family response regulator/pSer/pThr/pTyr-binding forkhead associated (FHA) protein
MKPRHSDAETLTAQSPQSGGGVLALHVTGPNGGSRHILRDGLTSLGRGAEATLVIDDPRASRSHAMLSVGRQIQLSDLESANGTFVGTERLRPGEARTLEVGQAFRIGDTVLVLSATTLPKASKKRMNDLSSVAALLTRLAGERKLPASVVLKLHVLGQAPLSSLESVLDEQLRGPNDWMIALSRSSLLVGVEASPGSKGVELERSVMRELASWGIAVDLEARVLSAEDVVRAGTRLQALLVGDGPMNLDRGTVVVRDPAMTELKRTIQRVAPAAINVLILGETGAGKDVVASMLHEFSSRADKPCVGLNCASMPETLLESELFGYERGAFTGAAQSKPGLLETANGGTLFLDEVGDLPLSLQAKLLRVIESQELTRLGAVKPRAIDVRFVAATNHDLAADIAEGRFRQDLYYRLNSVTLKVPPLRERTSEIEPLARLFLENARQRFGAPPLRLSDAALGALAGYPWPGNVRELRSAIERAVLLATTDVIEPVHLGLPSTVLERRPPSNASTKQPSEPMAVQAGSERERIENALLECAGNQSRAAELLGMSRRTLVRRIAELGLPRPRR